VIGTITNSAQNSIARAIDETAVRSYFEAVFANLATIRDGMTQAADGAAQLDAGLATAREGSTQLRSGAATAATGADSLGRGDASRRRQRDRPRRRHPAWPPVWIAWTPGRAP
jgi:putative membrane protein